MEDIIMNHPEATSEALNILRTGDNFQWYVIFMLIAVLYIYFSEVQKKNWKGITTGLMVYMIHWLAEIINALIQHLAGHALWTIPKGTAYLILVGVGIELSLMFSIAGLAASKLLPPDPKVKVFGIPNRLFYGLMTAALASIIEIFLVMTPTFVWVWEWWNALTVFVFVYIPFFVTACYAYDWTPKKQKVVIGTLLAINVVLLVVFAGILQWI
jgi:hypothetical protein